MTVSKEIRGICFDLGGTTIDDGGIPTTQELGDLVGADLAAMRGYLQGSKVFREEPLALAARIKRDFEAPVPVEVVVAVLESRRAKARRPRVFAEAPGVMRELRRRGYLIATLSNVLGAIAPNPSDQALPGLVDVAFLSCDIGVTKPAVEAFAAVQNALNLVPGQMAHVGDSVGADIVGAIAAGWQAIHLVREPTAPQPCGAGDAKALLIRDLRSLLEIFPDRSTGPHDPAMR